MVALKTNSNTNKMRHVVHKSSYNQQILYTTNWNLIVDKTKSIEMIQNISLFTYLFRIAWFILGPNYTRSQNKIMLRYYKKCAEIN